MRGIKLEMKKRKSVVRIQRQKTQVPCSPLPCGAVSLFVCCCCCCCPLPLSRFCFSMAVADGIKYGTSRVARNRADRGG